MAALKFVIFVISLALFLGFYLYGIIFTLIVEEENLCRMTYMFEYPQFVKINFPESKNFPKYGLHVYSEGALIERTRAMDFTGAPVIFIPGNSGSLKQVRSLASVAIRKGIDNQWLQHLDYFSIDFNEEYSALFGGYLEEQRNYLKICIRAVLNLYRKLQNPPKEVILIGHSMGGIIAQSLLSDDETKPLINTIISIASPLDKPVVNFDSYFHDFYKKINDNLRMNRTAYQSLISNSTNFCQDWNIDENKFNHNYNISLPLDNKLLISIGGGNRDHLVHTGLTLSKSSDINVITNSIPNVWLTTDHLCSVWCLQLVLVLNRFLHSIIDWHGKRKPPGGRLGQKFIEDKTSRLDIAYSYFVRPGINYNKNREIVLSGDSRYYDWYEDSRRVYSKMYDVQSNKTIIEMIPLIDSANHKHLAVTAINIDNDDWIFGCSALFQMFSNPVHENMRYCSKATSLTRFADKLPPYKNKKYVITLDLFEIKLKNPSWTHVILKSTPKERASGFNVDVFDPNYRFIKIETPKWYSFRQQIALEETLIGSTFYKLEISGLDESYQSLALNIKPRICSKEMHHAVIKICIPYLRNCDNYHHLVNDDAENKPIYINVPITKPYGYNTTKNPISVYLHLDSSCRYQITYQNSFGGTLSQTVQQYSHWLPSHLAGILLLSFKHQINITPNGNYAFKCGKLHVALLSSSSFFIVTTTRIFAKIISGIELLPNPDNFNQSIIISIIMHGTALAILSIITVMLWLGIYIYGNMIHKILLKLINLPIPTITDSIMPFIEKIPISAGILLISIAFSSCGGIALGCGCLIYFMLIVKQYEDYLEEFVFHTAKIIAEKLFGKKKLNDNVVVENKVEEILDPETESSDDDDNSENAKPAILEKDNSTIANREENNSIQVEEEEVTNGAAAADSVPNNVKNEITKKSEILLNTLANSLDEEFPENVTEEELDQLLSNAIQKQTQLIYEKKQKENLERAEYDSVHEQFSSINFHMTLFILLFILTLLNLPSTISWAKNYSYNQRLSPDPSLMPACIVLMSASILWQLSTPRNLLGYKFLSYLFYICAASCILFCQDSVYRLNFLIPSVFVLVTLHQLLFPKKKILDENDLANEELREKIDKIRHLLAEEAANENKND